ncbi:hypothetical protein SAMN05518865_103123 [Duganella sp. CF458]|uniref:hypothetical protein n=1 Tax=Duganella sp. CF458 TaxID=1884368 RepID=UPI0008E3A65A|nr:hypothetical protein [Duganella sp. CF458]SFF68054.1 hypothetical protein SAMN05518865_103123 [Duganella sp. CF458]
MAATDKDIYQKERALTYCVANDLIPFLEVNVTNTRELADKPTFLTDIDVLGIGVDQYGVRRVIFDCKTNSKTSPINRSFWAAGLMQYVNGSEAFVILQKSALQAHKLSAKALKVHLFDEALFQAYAIASSSEFLGNRSYAVDIARWNKLCEYYLSNESFLAADGHLRHLIPLEEDFAKAFRGLLNALKWIKGELDPAKPMHQSIYNHFVSMASFTLCPVVNDIFDIFDPKCTKEQFEEILRAYIWGGKDSYRLRRKMKEVMASVNEHVSPEVELSHWDDFVEMIRSFLDSPKDLSMCPIPLMELALKYVDAPVDASDVALGRRLNRSSRIRPFIFRISGYLVKSAALPKEFDLQLRQQMNYLLSE